MITNLHVQNLALIDEADVSFRPGLNILTGETGAGKSILLGSINLALGQKMDSDLIRHGADHALVELVFEIEDPHVLEKLRALDVDTEDGLLILSRKVQDGRSSCRLNGETCTASRLREISSLLLDIHGQHEHQSLLYPDRQLEILDAYGKETLDPLLQKTADAYRTWKEAAKEREKYQIDEAARERELSLLKHEIREIEEADLKPGEDQELEDAYRRMVNDKRITETLQAVYQATGGTDGVGETVGRAVRTLHEADEWDTELQSLHDSLTDIENLLADFNREIMEYQEQNTFSQEDFYETEQRLDRINGLKAKYGKTIEDVLVYLDAQNKRLEESGRFAEKKKEAEEAYKRAQAELETAAQNLTRERRKKAETLQTGIMEELQDLNFLSVAFEIGFGRSEGYRPDGVDEIEFRISTNPGEPLRPLAKIASGGELSRIMLAIKALLADKDETETLLFDEIDTGVSGRTAQRVAEKMEQIGHSHQVLCVTHLAQLAAMADHHFAITKDAAEGSTQTHIYELSETESEAELARLLGGAAITEAVRANAREMRQLALRKKS